MTFSSNWRGMNTLSQEVFEVRCHIPLYSLKHGMFQVCSHNSNSARSGNAMRSTCATCDDSGDLRECDAFRGSIIA
jgi:hypothetical protein